MTAMVRFALAGLLALAAAVGASLYLTHSVLSRGQVAGRSPASSRAGTPSGLVLAAPPAVVTVPSRHAAARAHQTHARPSPRPSTRATVSPPTAQGAAAQVLALINRARSAAGLTALTITAGLRASSAAHNLRMAGGCGLSHQCQGEPPVGDRETDAGVHWTAAGENIGEGGPVAGSPAAIAVMAVGLTQSMLDERPPDDGHRLNILSRTFTHIGIAVYRDSSGTVWLTQDFSN